MILFSSGYDSHHYDPLGGLNITANFYGEIIKKFQEVQTRIVCTLEGGYNLEWMGKCIVSQLAQMNQYEIKIDDSSSEYNNVNDLIQQIKKIMKKYWEL